MEEKKQALLSNLKLASAPPQRQVNVEEKKQILMSIPLRFKTTPEEAEPLAAAFAAARDKAAEEKAAQDAAKKLKWEKMSEAERREAEALAAIEEEDFAESERRNLKKAQSAAPGRASGDAAAAAAAPAAAHSAAQPTQKRPSLKPALSLSRIPPRIAEGDEEQAHAPQKSATVQAQPSSRAAQGDGEPAASASSAEAAAADRPVSGTQARLSQLPQTVRDAMAKKSQALDSDAPRAGPDAAVKHNAGGGGGGGGAGGDRGVDDRGSDRRNVADADHTDHAVSAGAADVAGWAAAAPQPRAAAAAAAAHTVNIQGIFVKSASDSFVALSKSQR
jgi:hypothetical protein